MVIFRDVGRLLLSHCSSHDLSSDFSATKGILGENYWFGSFFSVEESQVKLSVSSEITCAGQTEGQSWSLFTFSALLFSRSFVCCFLTRAGFSDGMARHGL